LEEIKLSIAENTFQGHWGKWYLKHKRSTRGELGGGVSESGGAVAEEDSEVNLCEEIPSTTAKLRQRKRTVKFKEVLPQATRKRRSPEVREEREVRAHKMSVGRVRVTLPGSCDAKGHLDTREGAH
jgi:hypothetical protein